jgi:hypothetical protein
VNQSIKNIIIESVEQEKLSKQINQILIAFQYNEDAAISAAQKYGIVEDIMRKLLKDDHEEGTQERVDVERLLNKLFLSLPDEAKIRMLYFGFSSLGFFGESGHEYTPEGRLIVYLDDPSLLFRSGSDDVVSYVFSDDIFEKEFYDFYEFDEYAIDDLNSENLAKIKKILSDEGFNIEELDSDKDLMQALKESDTDLNFQISQALTDAVNDAFRDKLISDVKGEIESYYGTKLIDEWNDEYKTHYRMDMTDVILTHVNDVIRDGHFAGQPVITYTELIDDGVVASLDQNADIPKITIDDYRYYYPSDYEENFNYILSDMLYSEFGV